MLRAIVFHGKKQFTAEYYSTEIKNRSYGANQANGYYKGYGNELRYAIISDRTFRINSGLFTVQGRQCAVVLGTQEDVLVPAQEQEIKGYIIARINTNVLTGDNVELDYKLGTNSSFPTLVQQETYSIDENTSAIYELPLYSFTIYRSITNVVRMIKPIKNMQVQIDDSSLGISDYLYENGLYIRKIDNKYYEFYKFDGENLSKLNVNADYINGNTLEVALQNKADLVNGKLPVSQLPETGITADTANAVAYGTGQTYSGDAIVSDKNKNMLHLGAFDVYPYNNDNKKVLRQTGYINIDSDTDIFLGGSYTNILYYAIIKPNDYIGKGSYDSGIGLLKATKFEIAEEVGGWDNANNVGRLFNQASSDNLWFGFAVGTTLEQAKAYMYGVQIQYKLVTPYTEDIIPNQPINVLDCNLQNKLNQKMFDGLNLFDVRTLESGGINSTNGADVEENSYCRTRGYINVISNQSYHYSKNTSSYGFYIYLYNNGTFVQFIDSSGIGGILNIPSNVNQIRFKFNGTVNDLINTNIMLNKGNHTYPYSDFNQKEHITNDEATLLKQEEEKCSNLCPTQEVVVAEWSVNLKERTTVKPNTTYTISAIYSGDVLSFVIGLYNGTTLIQQINSENYATSYTFTTPSNCDNILIKFGASSYTATTYSITNIMLVEGSEAKPYQEWNGPITHMKDLEYYGSKPSVLNMECNPNFLSWQNYSQSVSSGSSISRLSLDSETGGYVQLYPNDSYKSVTVYKVEYVSGDQGYIEYRTGVPSSNNSTANAYNIYSSIIYGLAATDSRLVTKTTTFRLTVKDMYGKTYTKDFTISYKVLNI